MKPSKFKHWNKRLEPPTGVEYSKNVEGIDPLHVFTDGEQCISLWRMSLRERLSALVFGRVWIAVLSGGTQHPICAEACREYLTGQPT